MTGHEGPPIAAIIGSGVIGGGWAARFLLSGWDVRIFDPDTGAPSKIEALLDQARASLPGIYDAPLPDEGTLQFSATLSEAVAGAGWIQESVPERLELKQKVYQTIQATCDDGAVIASSTSGFKPSDLQSCASRPRQILVAHPFNPVYLLPLVELVGTRDNGDLIAHAAQILREIGMFPLQVRAEIDAHIADRFLEAVWREALWLIKDGVATTEEIDEAIRMGFGLRWGQMGLFETYRIAGGEAGMRHFISQFGPALKWPWTRLMDVPELDTELVDQIAAQSDAQAAGASIGSLERRRDANLVAMLRALKYRGQAAGAVLREHDQRLLAQSNVAATFEDLTKIDQPLLMLDRAVPSDWTDYNGHMNEAKYLQAFGDATDRFMWVIGCDDAYIQSGGSYFTAETHIRHLDEARAGARITVHTQILQGEGKKLHLFHVMRSGARVLATGEHFLLHVSLATRRPAPPSAEILDKLSRIAQAHERLEMPDGAGRAVGQRP
ncbi:MAG: carnitine 3-dehydrogenase [Pseudomonadota bacterium]